MEVKRIYSKNADYQRFEVLKTNRNKRYRYGEFFVEGVRNINEAIENGWEISSFLYSFEKNLSGWARDTLRAAQTPLNYALTDALIAELSGKQDASELLAVVKMREDDASSLDLGEKPILALFDRPSNRGNLGTIIRSCDALGVDALVITGHAVDLYDPDTVVASMGSFFKVPVIRMADNQAIDAWMNALRHRYHTLSVIGTSSHAPKSIWQLDLTEPTLFLIGNETDGLSKWLMENCDQMATIPMYPESSATSFNVACAATVMFYEAVRQRSNTPE